MRRSERRFAIGLCVLSVFSGLALGALLTWTGPTLLGAAGGLVDGAQLRGLGEDQGRARRNNNPTRPRSVNRPARTSEVALADVSDAARTPEVALADGSDAVADASEASQVVGGFAGEPRTSSGPESHEAATVGAVGPRAPRPHRGDNLVAQPPAPLPARGDHPVDSSAGAGQGGGGHIESIAGDPGDGPGNGNGNGNEDGTGGPGNGNGHGNGDGTGGPGNGNGHGNGNGTGGPGNGNGHEDGPEIEDQGQI